jgi:hypothetical protein
MTTTDAPPRDETPRRRLPKTFAAPALLVALYAGARLWRLAGECLWFDEIFGLHAASHTWGGMWSFLAADLIHPPLFYALLKLWVAAGGDSILWLELFSYFVSLACLVPFLLLARELRLGAAATNVALLLFAAGGYLIKYAQEVRMYALLLLLALSSLWLFARLVNAGRLTRATLFAVFLVNLALVYTHYYGWLVVCAEGLYLALRGERGRLRGFAGLVAALVASFAPWAWACARAAGEGRGLSENVGWIERPALWDALGFYGLLQEPFYFKQTSADPLLARGGALAGALLFGAPLVLLLLRSLRGKLSAAAHAADGGGRTGGVRDGGGRFLAFFSLFPVVVSFAASYMLPYAVWGTRHLIVAGGPYVLLAGLAVARLRPAWLRAVVVASAAGWFALAGALTLARPEIKFVWCAWGELTGRTFREEARAAGATDIYAFEDLVAYQLWHELRGAETPFRVAVVKGVGGLLEDRSFFLPRRFDGVARLSPEALAGERFWVAYRGEAFDRTRPPLDLLAARGYRVERVRETAAQRQRAFLVLVAR